MKQRLRLAEALARGELSGREKQEALAVPAIVSQVDYLKREKAKRKGGKKAAGKEKE